MLRIADTHLGRVEGLPAADPRITSFKGIPFARPPIGNLRFHAPLPAEPWDGLLQAYKFGPIAVQPTPYYDPDDLYCREWSVDRDIPMSEDCLYLNVWTPANTADEKLPVYVWIYGGAFQTGYTAEMEFDGERIARRGIVVVTLSYRLNIFGFLCHPEITAENPGAPANFGLLDQRIALQWVRDNIAAFGGDPDCVTLGGQSAGGASVMNQIMHGADGLFSRAVCHSGMFRMPGENIMVPRSLREAETLGEKFFRFAGVGSLEELRQMSTAELRTKWDEYGGFAKSIQTWLPVRDDLFIRGGLFEQLERNAFRELPLLTGYTADEFRFPVDPPTKQPLNPGDRQHDGSSGGESFNAIERAVHSYQQLAEANGGGQANYVYEFDVHMPGWDKPGVFHSADLWFWFESLAKCWRPFNGAHYDVARRMCNYLCNYIKTGDPNGNDSDGSPLPLWEPFGSNGDGLMGFRLEEDGGK